MWRGEPVDIALSVLAAWKVVDQEVKRLTSVARPTPGTTTLALFGGHAELSPSADTWTWTATAADGTRSDRAAAPTKEEAAALAGAFLKDHAR